MSLIEVPKKGLVLPKISDPGASPALEAILQDIYWHLGKLAEESNTQSATLDDHEARLDAGGL